MNQVSFLSLRWWAFAGLTLAALLTGCEQQSSEPTATDAPAANESSRPEVAAVEPTPHPVSSPLQDKHSFANTDKAVVSHLDWDVDIDFDRQQITGTATLTFRRVADAATEIVLDTRDLTIERAYGESVDDPLAYRLGDVQGALGQALTVELPSEGDTITIAYRTSPQASGLQWLSPQQTAGEHPFLFSQAQAIHARSFIPLQDTPQVRFTYNATVRTPKALRAVMSAHNNPAAEENGEFNFEMPQAIPSYLMAIGVGDLDFQPMSDRTGVYAEPQILAAAAAEFADTEAMMVASERLFGPYKWGRYDLLILPASFPFGGMENPRLSFITPTVIAGDKSLVALIAHELAHSWSGNLVTNATWNDLWLNEGFTVYLESRIMEVVFDKRREQMEAVLGYQDLREDLEALPVDDQKLVLSLGQRDPDDAFSQVPYEKGRLFVVWLEKQFGRDTLDAFLRQYFDEFGFQSLTSAEFVAYMQQHLLDQQPGKVTRAQIDAWLHQPGLPSDAVVPESDAFELVDAERERFNSGSKAAALETANWSVHEWLYFLNGLPAQLTTEQLQDLDKAFALTDSTNNEIAHSWLLIAIRNDYQPAAERLQDYLISIGRRKLIVPLYRELMNDEAFGQQRAREIYAKARAGYHPLAQGTIDAIVNPVD